MGFAKEGPMRPWTIVIGIGVTIFSFGLCLLIFGRAYYRDPTHHDLLLAFGCVLMVPGGILILFGCLQLLRIYLYEEQKADSPSYTAPYQPPLGPASEDVFDSSGQEPQPRMEYKLQDPYYSARSGKSPI